MNDTKTIIEMLKTIQTKISIIEAITIISTIACILIIIAIIKKK